VNYLDMMLCQTLFSTELTLKVMLADKTWYFTKICLNLQKSNSIILMIQAKQRFTWYVFWMSNSFLHIFKLFDIYEWLLHTVLNYKNYTKQNEWYLYILELIQCDDIDQSYLSENMSQIYHLIPILSIHFLLLVLERW
jgi:hypothetical protein